MGKGIATIAVWLGPAIACYFTGFAAWAFIMSFFGTLAIWESEI